MCLQALNLFHSLQISLCGIIFNLYDAVNYYLFGLSKIGQVLQQTMNYITQNMAKYYKKLGNVSLIDLTLYINN